MSIVFKCKLQDILRERGMTQKELSEKSGVAACIVCRYHTGTIIRIDLRAIGKIMKALNLKTLDELFETTWEEI